MDSQQPEVPSPNAEPVARRRTKWALWSAIGLIMYGAYVALSNTETPGGERGHGTKRV